MSVPFAQALWVNAKDYAYANRSRAKGNNSTAR